VRVDSVTTYLAADHDRLDAILAEVCQELDGGRAGVASVRFGDFHRGLRRHIRIEEELVFPFFDLRSGMSGGPTAVMREEHRTIEQALVRMDKALAAGDDEAFRAGVGDLRQVLGDHNEREERVLYPMTDRMLSDGERAVFVQRLMKE
jgi:hemerythrin-like domain-containing protein